MMVLKCSASYVAKVVHFEYESHFCYSSPSPSPSSSSSSEVLWEQLRSVLSQFSAVFASVNDKVSNQQFKSWKKQLETHMKRSIHQWELVNSHYTTERILFILFGSLGHSEILSVVLPQLRIQVCCSHYFWFQNLCLLDIRICFGPVLAKPAMFYPVKTWKYKYTWIYMISSPPAVGRAGVSPSHFVVSETSGSKAFDSLASLLHCFKQNKASVRISINYPKNFNFFISTFWHPASGFS